MRGSCLLDHQGTLCPGKTSKINGESQANGENGVHVQEGAAALGTTPSLARESTVL